MVLLRTSSSIAIATLSLSLSLSLSLHGFVFFALRILSSSSGSDMAAVAVSAGVVFKQGMSSLGASEFVGKVAKQFAVAAPTVKSQNATVISVRAAGYDEELVKTAVLRFFISFNNLSLHLYVLLHCCCYLRTCCWI
jgi:hypothetical protein